MGPAPLPSRPQLSQPARPEVVRSSHAHEPAVGTPEQREFVCSVVGLTVKLGLVAVVGVSLTRVAMAYQERMERQRELSAVLQIEAAKLSRARSRFDQLFMKGGEQRLVREQAQWIAPNRLRVVWRELEPSPAFPSVEQSGPLASSKTPTP